MANRYFIINKPFGMLSQFRKEAEHHRTLGELYPFPSDVYPIGRLDRDSEGLLILTNDKSLNARLLRPEAAHSRTYWVQVEGNPDQQALKQLAEGVKIRVNKRDYLTQPAKAMLLPAEWSATVQARKPPIRVRKTVPDSWLELQLTEGKNRQVRRMCAAVGYPVLRLIRTAIGQLQIQELGQENCQEVAWEWLQPLIFAH